MFFSAVFFEVLELIQREAPKDFCCFSHIPTAPGEFSCVSRFAELLCPPANPLQGPTAIASAHQSAVTVALLPSVKVTLMCSLSAILRNMIHLEISSGYGHSTYSKSGKVWA